jgi:diguanylate cyclase
LSLDNFGSGQSSLQSLDCLPANEIKIDSAYIADINSNSMHRKLVKSMIDLGRHVGASVVATGIESDQQCQYLTQLGCQLLQGSFVDEPMTADQLILSYSSIAHISEAC